MKATLAAHFMVDVTLYPTERGGRVEPITREGFACPCKLDEQSNTVADCRLLLCGQKIWPGQTKRVGIRFTFDAVAPTFRSASKFFLWDGRIIGEVKAV